MSSSIIDAANAIAWSHWTGLGVAGVAKLPDAAVDLEALVLLTAVIAEHDPRLRDEALDWCAQFGSRFVSVGRMRALSKSLDAESLVRVQLFAATTNAVGGTNWPSEAAKGRIVRLSGKSRLRLETPECALLRLRCVFGVTARAEVLLSLLTRWNPSTYVRGSELSDLGYGKSALTQTLEELTMGGITQRRSQGNAYMYQLRNPGELKKLLNPIPLRASDWHLRMLVLIDAVRLEETIMKKSSVVQSVEARKFVDSNAGRLSQLGADAPSITSPQTYWEEVRPWLAEALVKPVN